MIYLKTLLAEAKLKMNIPSDIKKIYKAFKKSGKQLFVVGGAVRDAILGSSPKDFDLATNAKPDEVMKIAKANGMKAIDVGGKSFGVVEVNGHEVATFRKDIGKGRRPTAVDYTDIKGDVKRRDLTINALFYDMGRGEIVDLVGGIADLKKKKIKTVGNPIERFDEDPLRKLRALRFTSLLKGRMGKVTWQALKDNPTLPGISGERIRDELIKGIKKSKSVPQYFKMIHTLGMFKQIFPGLNVGTDYLKTNDYIVQIANLLKKNKTKLVQSRLSSLKYHNKEVANISFLLMLLSEQDWVIQNLPAVKALQKNTSITDKQLKMWAGASGRNSSILKIWKWKIITSAKDALDKGLKGKAIGDYIKDEEYNRFIKS